MPKKSLLSCRSILDIYHTIVASKSKHAAAKCLGVKQYSALQTYLNKLILNHEPLDYETFKALPESLVKDIQRADGTKLELVDTPMGLPRELWYSSSMIDSLIKPLRDSFHDNDTIKIADNIAIESLNAWCCFINQNHAHSHNLLLPLNLKESHWVLVYINTANHFLAYIDPLGSTSLPEDLCRGLNNLKKKQQIDFTELYVSPLVLQKDNYQCGPWLVLIMQTLLANTMNYDKDTLFNLLEPLTNCDIAQVRALQQDSLASDVLIEPLSRKRARKEVFLAPMTDESAAKKKRSKQLPSLVKKPSQDTVKTDILYQELQALLKGKASQESTNVLVNKFTNLGFTGENVDLILKKHNVTTLKAILEHGQRLKDNGLSVAQLMAILPKSGTKELFFLISDPNSWKLLTALEPHGIGLLYEEIIKIAKKNGGHLVLKALLTYWNRLNKEFGFSKKQIVKIASNDGATPLFELLFGSTEGKPNWFLLTNTLKLSKEQIVKIASNHGATSLFEFLLGSTGDKSNWFLLTNTLGLSKEQIVNMASNNGATLLFKLLLGSKGNETNWFLLTDILGFSEEQLVKMASNPGATPLFELLLGSTEDKPNWFVLTNTFGLSKEQIVKMASNNGATLLFKLLFGSTEGKPNWFLLTNTLKLSTEQLVKMASNGGATLLFELLLGSTEDKPNWFLLTDTLGFSKKQIVKIASNTGATQLFKLLLGSKGNETNWFLLTKTLGFSIKEIVKMASNDGATPLFELLLGSTEDKPNWFLLTSTLNLSKEQIVKMSSNDGSTQLFKLLLGSKGNETNWFLLTHTLGFSKEQIVKIASNTGATSLFELLLESTEGKPNWFLLTNTLHLSKEQIVKMSSNDGATQLFKLLLGSKGNETNWFLLTNTLGFSIEEIVKMASNIGAGQLFKLLLGSTEDKSNWFLLTNTLGFSKEQIVKMASNAGATKLFELLLGSTGEQTNWHILTKVFGFDTSQIVSMASHEGARQVFEFLLGNIYGKENKEPLAKKRHSQSSSHLPKNMSQDNVEKDFLYEELQVLLNGNVFQDSTNLLMARFLDLGFSHENVDSMIKQYNVSSLKALLDYGYRLRANGFSVENLMAILPKTGAGELFSLISDAKNWMLLTAPEPDGIGLFHEEIIQIGKRTGGYLALKTLITKWPQLDKELGLTKEQIVNMVCNNEALQLGRTDSQTNWHLLTNVLEFNVKQIVSIASRGSAKKLFELFLSDKDGQMKGTLLTKVLGFSQEQVVRIAHHSSARKLFDFLLGNTGEKTNWYIITQILGFTDDQIIRMASHNGAKKLFDLLMDETNWNRLTKVLGFAKEQIASIAFRDGARQVLELLLDKVNWNKLTNLLGFTQKQIVDMASYRGAKPLFDLLLGNTGEQSNWCILTNILGFTQEQIVGMASHDWANRRLQLLLESRQILFAADGLNCSIDFLARLLVRPAGGLALSWLLQGSVSVPTRTENDFLSFISYYMADARGRYAALNGSYGCRNFVRGKDYLLRYYQGYFNGLVEIGIISDADSQHIMGVLKDAAAKLQHKKDDATLYCQVLGYLDLQKLKNWRMLCRSITREEVAFPFAYYKMPQGSNNFPSEAIVINFDDYVIEGVEPTVLSLKAKQQLANIFMYKYYKMLQVENQAGNELFDDFQASYYKGYVFIKEYGHLSDLVGVGELNFQKDITVIPVIDFNRMPVENYLKRLATQKKSIAARDTSKTVQATACDEIIFISSNEEQEQELLYDLDWYSTQIKHGEQEQLLLYEEESLPMPSFARSPHGLFGSNLSSAASYADNNLDIILFNHMEEDELSPLFSGI